MSVEIVCLVGVGYEIFYVLFGSVLILVFVVMVVGLCQQFYEV